MYQPTVSFEIFLILYFATDLAEIWLRGQVLGANSESKVIFYIRGLYQADIGHFLQFLPLKGDKHSLIIGLLLATIKVTDYTKLIFLDAPYID